MKHLLFLVLIFILLLGCNQGNDDDDDSSDTPSIINANNDSSDTPSITLSDLQGTWQTECVDDGLEIGIELKKYNNEIVEIKENIMVSRTLYYAFEDCDPDTIKSDSTLTAEFSLKNSVKTETGEQAQILHNMLRSWTMVFYDIEALNEQKDFYEECNLPEMELNISMELLPYLDSSCMGTKPGKVYEVLIYLQKDSNPQQIFIGSNGTLNKDRPYIKTSSVSIP